MGLGHYLFSFSGRINRAKMWLFFLIVFIYICIVIAAVLSIIGTPMLQAIAENRADMPGILGRLTAGAPIMGALGLVDLVLIFCGLAITTKRLHDRNKSAWWLLLFVVLPAILGFVRIGTFMSTAHGSGMLHAGANPLGTLFGGVSLIIQLWAFVELYFLRGTAGDNRFGPDPLAGRD